MNPVLIIDSGPLVALARKQDQYNRWCLRQLQNLSPPFITCESVISETCFILGMRKTRVLDLLEKGFLQVEYSLKQELEATVKLMRKYADVPMSLADACLVRMSEIHDNCKVFTLDSDFKIYKRNGRRAIPLIYPG